MIAFLIFGDLFHRFFEKNKLFLKFKKHSLTARNYLGMAIIIVFIIWPSINEATFGSFSIKKLETKVESIKSMVEDIYGRKMLEYWYKKDVNGLKVDKKDRYYHYELPLKNIPVEKSIDFWLGNQLQNPMYYSVDRLNKKIIYRTEMATSSLLNYLGESEPAFAVQYIRE